MLGGTTMVTLPSLFSALQVWFCLELINIFQFLGMTCEPETHFSKGFACGHPALQAKGN